MIYAHSSQATTNFKVIVRFISKDQSFNTGVLKHGNRIRLRSHTVLPESKH